MKPKSLLVFPALMLIMAGCVPLTTDTNTTDVGSSKNLSELRKKEDILQCAHDSDCISVRNGSCCHCKSEVINKKYKDEWGALVAKMEPCTGKEFCTQNVVRCGVEPKCSELGTCYLD